MRITKANTNGSSQSSITKNIQFRLSRESKFIFIYCLAFFLVYLSFSYYQHINLKTSLFDMGLQEHVIRQTANGRFFQSGVETNNYLGDHFSLIILPISIIYKILPHTLTLLFIQTASITMALVGIFKLSKQQLISSNLSIFLTIIFSWYWGISGLLLFDFHMEGLALPLLIWGLYLVSKKKVTYSLILFALAMICKEDIGIFVGMVGTYLLFKHQYRYGLILMFFGFVYSSVVIFKVMPDIRGSGLDTMFRYHYLGNSPTEMLKNTINSPSLLFNELASLHKLKYLLKLFLPTGGLFIFAPWSILLFLPHLILNLLAQYTPQSSALYQYDIATTVGIFFGSILGITKLESLREKRPRIRQIIPLMILPLIVFNVVFIITHPLFDRIRNFESREEAYKSVQIVEELIPDNAIVSVSNSLGPQFVGHENLLLFDPDWISYQISPEYIIIDKQECCTKPNQDFLTQELTRGNIKVFFEDPSILVYSHLL